MFHAFGSPLVFHASLPVPSAPAAVLCSLSFSPPGGGAARVRHVQVHDLFKKMDIDREGTISFSELEALFHILGHLQPEVNEEHILELFDEVGAHAREGAAGGAGGGSYGGVGKGDISWWEDSSSPRKDPKW